MHFKARGFSPVKPFLEPNMGAFIGTGDVGIWASNGERNDFLDWFAENRCSPDDTRWQWCKSEAQRWNGRCLDLSEFLPPDEVFHVSEAELREARKYGPQMLELLKRVQETASGEWLYTENTNESVTWRPPRLSAAPR